MSLANHLPDAKDNLDVHNTLIDIPLFDHLVVSPTLTHAPKAGINPIVDAAAPIFSYVQAIKDQLTPIPVTQLQLQLNTLLMQIQEQIASFSYNAETIAATRFILSAFIDDELCHTTAIDWDNHALLTHHDKEDAFFNLLKRLCLNSGKYIELIELMAICLQLGYQGKYRHHPHEFRELETIIDDLHQHIKSVRGQPIKTLAPFSIKAKVLQAPVQSKNSWLFIFFMSSCIIMTTFVTLGYFTERSGHDAYQHFTELSHQTSSSLA